MRLCVDCGSDISDRGATAYLCLRCVDVRKRVDGKRRYRETMTDPLRRARRRAKHRAWAKAHYTPVANPKTTVETCEAEGCSKTFVRVYHATKRRFCDDCQAFYARATENAGQRRRYYARKQRREAA